MKEGQGGASLERLRRRLRMMAVAALTAVVLGIVLYAIAPQGVTRHEECLNGSSYMVFSTRSDVAVVPVYRNCGGDASEWERYA